MSINFLSIYQGLSKLYQLASASAAPLSVVLKEQGKLPHIEGFPHKYENTLEVNSLPQEKIKAEIREKVAILTLDLFKRLSSDDQTSIRKSILEQNPKDPRKNMPPLSEKASKAILKRKRADEPYLEGLAMKRIYILNSSDNFSSLRPVFYIDPSHPVSVSSVLDEMHKFYEDRHFPCIQNVSSWIENNSKKGTAQNIKNSMRNLFLYYKFYESDRLIFSDCDYLKKIPTILFNEKSKFKYLKLNNSRIDYFPDDFSTFPELEEIDCSNNKIRKFPEFLKKSVHLREINFSYNRIDELPLNIGDFSSLIRLDLSGNQLQNLPGTIGNLASLKFLDISDNPLTSLPNEVLLLQSDCRVNIERTNLSSRVLEALRLATLSEEYRGPQILFSTTDSRSIDLGSIRPLSELMDELYIVGEASSRDFPNLLARDEQTLESLRIWLSRLSDTADYKAGGEYKKSLALKILNYLDLADTNLQFQETLFQTIEKASETCGDRVALSILSLGVQRRLIEINKSDTKLLANFLLGTVWSLELLETVAGTKIRTLSFVDEIEVYLAYPIRLKEILRLEIDVENMLYFNVSYVTKEDLNAAVEFIQMQQGNEEAKYIFLASRDDWRQAMRQAYPKETAEIRVLEENESKDSNEQGNWDCMLKVREQRWENLTKKHLSANF